MLLGRSGGPHSSKPYHSLLLIMILKKLRYILLPWSYAISAKLCILCVEMVAAYLFFDKLDSNIVWWSKISPKYLN